MDILGCRHGVEYLSCPSQSFGSGFMLQSFSIILGEVFEEKVFLLQSITREFFNWFTCFDDAFSPHHRKDIVLFRQVKVYASLYFACRRFWKNNLHLPCSFYQKPWLFLHSPNCWSLRVNKGMLCLSYFMILVDNHWSAIDLNYKLTFGCIWIYSNVVNNMKLESVNEDDKIILKEYIKFLTRYELVFECPEGLT